MSSHHGRLLNALDSTGRCNTPETAQAEGVLQMKQRPMIYCTESQKAIKWDRWQKGESLQQIARLFDRNHSSVQGIQAQSGAIRPAPRPRLSLALTLVEPEEISRALASGHSARSIAVLLERAPSTISREIKRKERCHCDPVILSPNEPLKIIELRLEHWTRVTKFSIVFACNHPLLPRHHHL